MKNNPVISVRPEARVLGKCREETRTNFGSTVQEKSCSKGLTDIYKIDRLLGEGCSGKVYAATRTCDGLSVAIKIITKENIWKQREIDILSRVDHPNLMHATDIFTIKWHSCIVTSLMDHDLVTLIKQKGRLGEVEVREVVRQLLSGLSYLRKKGIVHRDLKPENILCRRTEDGVEVKISDFGSAEILARGSMIPGSAQLATTPLYAAPEQILCQPYAFPIDMWACGVIMYNMLTGKDPFGSRSISEALKKILSGRYPMDENDRAHLSADAKSLMSRMLEVDPRKRIGVKEAASHAWLS